MNDGQFRFSVVMGYFAILIILGLFANRVMRGTKKDYLFASHSIGPVLLLLSIFGTTMTAFAMLGSTGEAFRKGIGVYGKLASASGIVHSLCFFLIGAKLFVLGRKYGYQTQIQFFTDRLNNKLIGVILFPLLVCLTIPYLLVGIIGGGDAIQTMTVGAFPDRFPDLVTGVATAKHGAIPAYLGSAIVCVVVLFYVFSGGIRGTAWANAFQTMVFVILGVITFALIAQKLGGQEDLLSSMQAVTSKVDQKFITRSDIPKSEFLMYLLIPLSVAMFPHLFQHWLTARSAATFKLTVVCHPIFVMIVWLPCILMGIWATTLELPPEMNQNQILPYLVMSQLSPVIGGLLTAGVLAAIMSSLDSQSLCLGSMFTNDIVEPLFGRNRLSDRQQVFIARGFIILIVGLSYGFSIYIGPHSSIFALGVWCFSGLAALFPLVFAALYWRRLTAAGAIASVMAAAISWSYLFWDSEWGTVKGYVVRIPGVEIDFLPVAPMVALAAIVLVGVSLMTSPPPTSTVDKFFDAPRDA
jgi:solute:Na+ symporter, SSS family